MIIIFKTLSETEKFHQILLILLCLKFNFNLTRKISRWITTNFVSMLKKKFEKKIVIVIRNLSVYKERSTWNYLCSDFMCAKSLLL